MIRKAKVSDQDLPRYKVDRVEWFGLIELLVFSIGTGTETSAWLPLSRDCRQ
jgi:hypothetical protein